MRRNRWPDVIGMGGRMFRNTQRDIKRFHFRYLRGPTDRSGWILDKNSKIHRRNPPTGIEALESTLLTLFS